MTVYLLEAMEASQILPVTCKYGSSTHHIIPRYHAWARLCTQCRFAGFGLCTCCRYQVPDVSLGGIHSNEDHRAHSQGFLSVSFLKGVCWAHNIAGKHMNFYGEIKLSILSGFKLSMTSQ